MLVKYNKVWKLVNLVLKILNFRLTVKYNKIVLWKTKLTNKNAKKNYLYNKLHAYILYEIYIYALKCNTY